MWFAKDRPRSLPSLVRRRSPGSDDLTGWLWIGLTEEIKLDSGYRDEAGTKAESQLFTLTRLGNHIHKL
jgi:hypothetical protein